jgi:hypothetical protein
MGPCPDCGAVAPPLYEILAGNAPAPASNMTYVDRIEQDRIVQSASWPEVAFVPHPLNNHVLLVERLIGKMVDIMGIDIGDRGASISCA